MSTAVIRTWNRRVAVQRLHGWAVLAAFLLLAVAAAPAKAGYEYTTPVNDCKTKVDIAGDNKNLRIYPGTTRFQVFGSLVDLSALSENFRFDDSANFSARVVSTRIGYLNEAIHCGLIGSAVIEVTKPVASATAAANHWIEIRMPLGDWTRVPITVLPFPNHALTWTGGSLRSGANSCLLSADGSYAEDLDGARATIQLPVGHSRNSTACPGQFLELLATPTSTVYGDLPAESCRVSVQGLPTWLTLADTSFSCTSAATPVRIKLNIDAFPLRLLSSDSTSRITVRGGNPNVTSSAATLVARPNLALIGVTVPSSRLTAGEPVAFNLAFSFPPGMVTWRITQATCFRPERTATAYNDAAEYQFLSVPAGQTSASIRIRSVAKGDCAGRPKPVEHVFEAWIGDRRVNQSGASSTTSGYVRTTISLLAPVVF